MDLKSLGSGQTSYLYAGAQSGLLERFKQEWSGSIEGKITIVAPEFTSLCPKTGQPDFATIRIEYAPLSYCVESKSLKLYLGSFRQEGMFHEACVNRICADLVGLLDPYWINVTGEFSPRGGISFWPNAWWRQK